MRVSITLVSIAALMAGVFASPTCKRDEAKTDVVANVTNTTAVPPIDNGRCTPCNEHMDKCMGNWGCWFYDCQPGCTHEVCEQLPDCRQGCGYHC